jgi:hypothetical protein
MSNFSDISNFINDSHCDLGSNSKILVDLVSSMKNSRFMDLGVRFGPSSAIMSINADENNNQVCGCDLIFDDFLGLNGGSRFVSENYKCYQYDSVTLGKNWDEDPFDIIFVDTEHFREQVLAELYFWSNHLNEGGYFIFHDSHWECPKNILDERELEYVDVAITDFFGLPKSVRELEQYEDENLILEHYPDSYGMTFVKIKTIDAIEKFKKNIDWNQVFEFRNWYVNSSKSWMEKCGLNIETSQFELLINP